MSDVETPAVESPTEPAQWLNRFAGLGDRFFTELTPQGLPDPHWVAKSDDCAAMLGLPEA